MNSNQHARVFLPTKYFQFEMKTNFGLEAFDEDGNEQVEEDEVANGNQGYEVDGCPGRGRVHAVVQDHVPVFLRQYLQGNINCFEQDFFMFVKQKLYRKVTTIAFNLCLIL